MADAVVVETSAGTPAERFAARFRGLARAHGRYSPNTAKKPGHSKLEGKAVTLKKPVTPALFKQHLTGKYGLGIIPVTDNGTCWFGAIDIDRYTGLDLPAIEAQVTRLGLPLVVVRSKSGGCHLYLFCREPISAELVRAKLSEWARALGHAQAEIFPKQARISPNETGNWINLPYFCGDTTDRYAVRAGGRLGLGQFLDFADDSAVTQAELERVTISTVPSEDDLLYEAPPCLQCLAKQRVEDFRNEAVFNFGVYARKRWGDDDYVDKLDEYNQQYVIQPLGHKELNHIEASVGKRNYSYKCKQPPINAVCDRETCLTRKFGVGEGAKGSKKETALEVLFRVFDSASGELWHTSDRVPFASVTLHSHRENMPISSREFRRFLVHGYYHASGHPLKADLLQSAVTLMEAQAIGDGPEHSIAVRITELDGTTYIDLANVEREIVYLSADGWGIITDAPVRFYRPSTLRPLPRPVRGGSLDELRAFVTIREEDDWRLYMAFLLCCFRVGGPYPQLHLTGVQGSAKTTTAKMTLETIDPSKGGLRTLPRDERDLAIAAKDSHLLAFDNLSGVTPEMSDSLCRLSTGGGLGTRKLYTDDEQQVFDLMRPVVLNGINEIGVRPDLRDRAFVLELPPLDDSDRKDEATLWAQFYAALPAILGALYEVVCCALRGLDRMVLDGAPRMADATRWVSAAEPALGWEPGSFRALYRRHRDQSAKRAVEQDAFASAVLELADEADHELTPAGLLEALTDKVGEHISRQPFWPKTPRALTGALNRAAPDLAKLGVVIQRPPRGEDRRIFIGKEGRTGEARTAYEGM